jgi:hypothetical protein
MADSWKCPHCGNWISPMQVHEDCARKQDEKKAMGGGMRAKEDEMAVKRYMVCLPCLKAHFGGAEKCCSHGWDMLAGKPRSGTCSKCGQDTTSLHCPDGPEQGAHL